MEWKSELWAGWSWGSEIRHRTEKERVAGKVAAFAREGDVVGLGSGSTVYLALKALARRVHEEKLNIKVIPASEETAMACLQCRLPLTTLWENRPDWSLDGADEIDPLHNLIKGRGGALFKEKILMKASPSVYILADSSKFVSALGTYFPVPVEVFPWALPLAEAHIRRLGVKHMALRQAEGKDGAVITENGNYILEVWFEEIGPELESQLKTIPGVIENGLFMGYPVEILTS